MNDIPVINIPRSSLEKLFGIAGAAALRVFLIICSVVQDALARISVSELAECTRLTERTVFEALGQLEDACCISRHSRMVGPYSNEIRVTDLFLENTANAADHPTPAPMLMPVCEERTAEEISTPAHDEPAGIIPLVASCYRLLNDGEVQRTERFIAEQFADDINLFSAAVHRVRLAGGVAPESPLQFCFTVITANSGSR